MSVRTLKSAFGSNLEAFAGDSNLDSALSTSSVVLTCVSWAGMLSVLYPLKASNKKCLTINYLLIFILLFEFQCILSFDDPFQTAFWQILSSIRIKRSAKQPIV